ncbi:MAG: hypothetical protein ACO3IB_09690, partial [Phycisphaerales bacterium]
MSVDDCVHVVRRWASGRGGELDGRGGGVLAATPRMVAIDERSLRSEAALVRMAHCLERWIPRVGVVRSDGMSSESQHPAMGSAGFHGLVGEFTGCEAIFRRMHGSERMLAVRVRDVCMRRGFLANVCTASTIGSAVAVSRHAKNVIVVMPGKERESLASLPIESLRIPREDAALLHAVEVRRIGQLLELGRSGLAA